MLTLYGNAFSPFSRKVQLVLDHKKIDYAYVDGLLKSNHQKLATVNQRREVPAIDHDGLLVVNSAHIVAYLEREFPVTSVYPEDRAQWVAALAWERCADSVVDAILINISYWNWAIRDDRMPDGLLDTARRDLYRVYEALESALSKTSWICGDAISIADIALFPHLSAVRMLQVPFDETKHVHLIRWYKQCRQMPLFAEDMVRTKAYLSSPETLANTERHKIFWRGDRIEWMLVAGQQEWFFNEIKAGRVLWPDLGIPAEP